MKKQLLELCEKRLAENAEPVEGVFPGCIDSNTGIPETSKFYGKYILNIDDLQDFADEHNLNYCPHGITIADCEAIEKACDCKLDHHNEYENEEENVFLGDGCAYEVIFH